MLGTGLIVFRETLEAALFVGIVAASTRGVLNRGRWLTLGVSTGIIGSLAIASAMKWISSLADGLGQDFLTSIILSAALLMLAWHCIWVSTHAKEMVNEAKQLGNSATQGSKTLWALTIAVALSVLREGAETVLFVAGLISGTTQETSAMLLPIGSGLLLGAATGWLMYTGLARIKSKNLFSVTNVLILLLAGSLASQLAKTLSQANVLSFLADRAWDSSGFLPNNSSLGMLLHSLIGYDATPSQLQLLFYVCTTGLIWLATQKMKAHVHAQHTH